MLKRYLDDGCPKVDLPLLHWAMRDTLYRTQEAFYGVFENLPNRLIAGALRITVFPWGRVFDPPTDALGSQVVGLLMTPGPVRDRLTQGLYIPKDENDAVAAVDAALLAVIEAEPVEAKLRSAQRAGKIIGEFADQLAADGLLKRIIDSDESALLTRAKVLRRKVIMVDDFPKDFGRSEFFQTTQPVSFEALNRAPS